MSGHRFRIVWSGVILVSFALLLGCPPLECLDEDGDGYGQFGSPTCTGTAPDCDDADPDVNPGVTEEGAGDPACGDGLDNDCDGLVDAEDPGCHQPDPPGEEYSIERTLSDGAQRNTIAFDGLAFLTGNLGAQSFLPPGKVADYSGFQYLRDNDPTQMGHNTDFVTIVARNVLHILTEEQVQQLIERAETQVELIHEYAYLRFPLMDAFRRLLEGDLPEGRTGLDKDAVMAYSAALYRVDGEISYDRAELLGGVLRSMTPEQTAALETLRSLNGVGNWDRNLPDPLEAEGVDHDVQVAVMTYASEMYSWYAGSVEADTYFCPERQGTYFGSFYLKDWPAMGNPDYTIDEQLTARAGEDFLNVLTEAQEGLVASLVDIQRDDLYAIVATREQIGTQLRRFMTQETVDPSIVLSLSERYGELDGAIVYSYATHFAGVAETLDSAQEADLQALVDALGYVHPTGAFLYSAPMDMPLIMNSDYLFGVGDWPMVVPQDPGGDPEDPTSHEDCIDHTPDEGPCKDCCDCLEAAGETRRKCRDECILHEFSLNSDFIIVDAPSVLGPDGDYSMCVQAGGEQDCKDCCDGSEGLACGDRRFCRDACNATGF